jgi:hypothetical protein
VLDCIAIDLLLARVSASALIPCLGHSSVGELDRKSPVLIRTGRNF